MTKAILGVLMLAVMAGCATPIYKVVCIPDTPEGLSGYRQCATAPHYSQEDPCLAGIIGYSATGWLQTDERQVFPGCREIVNSNDGVYYYSIQACKNPQVAQVEVAKVFADTTAAKADADYTAASNDPDSSKDDVAQAFSAKVAADANKVAADDKASQAETILQATPNSTP